MRWILLTGLFMGCGPPGACKQLVYQPSREGIIARKACLEVEHKTDCPVEQSVQGEWEWEYSEGKSCPEVGFTESCGNHIFRLEGEAHRCEGIDPML